MEVEHADPKLERLEQDLQCTSGFGIEIARAFRKVMWLIRQAMDERDFYNMKSLHFEKLKGDRAHQRSMKLNKQWRLILELGDGPEKSVKVVGIEDYH